MPDQPGAIRFCTQNPRTNAERDALLAAGCVLRDCLSNCSRCFETRFLCVGDTSIEGEDYETILAQARALLDPPAPPTTPAPPTSGPTGP